MIPEARGEPVFALFACCIPVKGARRSTLCDLQRGSFQFIPNGLYEILTEHAGKTAARDQGRLRSRVRRGDRRVPRVPAAPRVRLLVRRSREVPAARPHLGGAGADHQRHPRRRRAVGPRLRQDPGRARRPRLQGAGGPLLPRLHPGGAARHPGGGALRPAALDRPAGRRWPRAHPRGPGEPRRASTGGSAASWSTPPPRRGGSPPPAPASWWSTGPRGSIPPPAAARSTPATSWSTSRPSPRGSGTTPA